MSILFLFLVLTKTGFNLSPLDMKVFLCGLYYWGNFFPFLVYWLFFIIKRCYTQKLRPETIKLLQENIGKTLSKINHSRILYYPPPRILEIKAKINKWDLIKIKKLLHNKGNYKQGEKTPLWDLLSGLHNYNLFSYLIISLF